MNRPVKELENKIDDALDRIDGRVTLEQKMLALKKTGRFIGVLLTIVRLALVFMMAGAVAMMIVAWFAPLRIESLLSTLDMSSTVHTLTASSKLPIADLELKYRLLIEIFMFLLALFLIMHLAGFLKEIFYDITEDGKPFEEKTAKKFRGLALQVLLLSLWNLPVALMLSMLSFLFAQVFSYGSYLQAKADENSRIQEDVILSFAEITEAKSGQTGQHVRRVSEYTRIIARAMGLADYEVEVYRIAAMMHDVGKLIVPTEILEKPARLTDEEFAIIKTHTSYGEELLKDTTGDILKTAELVAAEHHERWDGKGYHKGMSGEEIALPARIVAVADVYDALTSKRSYKEPWPSEKAREEIVAGSGTQFDPTVVAAFERSWPEIEAVRMRYADAADISKL